MDSFLEEPRSIPKPTPVIQEFEAPTVPEVSLMFQNTRKEKSPLINAGKIGQSYNAWKLRSSTQTPEMDSFLLTDKENTNDKSYLAKKQVRFESPVSDYSLGKMKKTSTSPLSENKSLNNDRNFEQVYNFKTVSQSPKFQTLKTPEPPKSISKAFEKLYISNIPSRSRELDLSFLEYQPRQCGSVNNEKYTNFESPNYIPAYTTRNYDFNETYKCYSPKINRTTTDIYQNCSKNVYKTPEISNRSLTEEELTKKIQEIKEKNQIETTQNETVVNTNQTENCDNKSPKKPKEQKINPDDPITVNELLAIIKLQNEQLQKLQKTVEQLVKISEKQEKVNKTSESTQQTVESAQQTSEPAPTIPERKNSAILLRDQQVGTALDDQQPPDAKNKISVGLMTSFEVRVKPPVIKKKKKQVLQPVDDETSSTSVYYEEKPSKKQQYLLNKQHERYMQQQKFAKGNRYYKEQRKNFDQRERVEKVNWGNEINETEYSLGSGEDLEVQEPPESPENSIHIDMQEYDTESSETDDECSTNNEGWTFYKDILGKVNHLLENSSKPSYTPRKELKTTNHNHYNDLNLEQIKHATMKRLQNDGFLQQNAEMNPTEVSFAVKQILMKYLPDEGLSNVHKNNYEEVRNPTDMSIAAFKYTQQYNLVGPNCYGRKSKKSRPKDPKILDITALKQQPKYL